MIPNRLLIRFALFLLGALVIGGIVLAIAIPLTVAVPRLPAMAPTVTPRPTGPVNILIDQQNQGLTRNAALATSLSYSDGRSKQDRQAICARTGLWTLYVNLQDKSSAGILMLPTTAEWAQADDAVQLATHYCSAPIKLFWGGTSEKGVRQQATATISSGQSILPVFKCF